MAELTPDQQFQETQRLRELRNQCLNIANGRALPGADAASVISEAEKLFDFIAKDGAGGK